MRNDDNYYGYHNDYDSGMLYLMEQPALRPLGDAPVWLKHALLMLGGKLLQWVLATVLMFASIIAMGSALLFALRALGINQAVQQKEMWAWAVVLIVVWFINMLPMVFSAGFVAIAAGVAEDGEFAFRRLFAGFGEQFGQLVKLALFWMLAAFALGILLGIAKPGSSPWVFLPMVLLFLLCNWMVLPLIMLQGVSVAMTGFASFARDGFSSVFLLLMLIFYTALFTVFPIISYVSYRNIWTSALLK